MTTPTPEQVAAAKAWTRGNHLTPKQVDALDSWPVRDRLRSTIASYILLAALENAEQEIENLTYEIKEANERE